MPKNEPQSAFAEWRWVLGIASLFLLLSSLPYWAGYRAQTDELVFSGAVFNRLDVDAHLAAMQLGAGGAWQQHLRFTSEPHEGAYVRMAYVLMGHTADVLGLAIPAAFQVFRLSFGLLACLGIYALMAQALDDLFWRRLAYVWALSGSGLGWLMMAIGWLPQPDISPIDFWLIDPYPFFGMLMFPHFSLVTALLAAMLVGFLSYLRRPRGWKLVLVAVAGVLAQLAQSYAPLLADLGMAGAVLAEFLRQRKIRWQIIGALAIIALTQIPMSVYGALVFWRNPLWGGFITQNITLSPPPVYYFWGFALLWPPTLWGIWRTLRRLPRGQQDFEWNASLAAIVWLVGALILAYLPWNLQRRFTHALMLPLAILAVTGLKDVLARWPASRKLLPLFLVGFSAISSLYLAFGLSMYIYSRPDILYDPAALVEAIDWLGTEASSNDVVLSASRSGQLVAARGGLVAYIGHPIETLDYDQKALLVEDYFSGVIGQADLPYCGCDWLIVGPYERALGSGFLPQDAELMYQNADVAVYKFNTP
jgi:hypothetical protein